MRRADACVGVVENGNTATLVTVDATGTLRDRRDIRLTDSGVPTHPYHHEGSWAVGRYLATPGTRRITLRDAVALVEHVRRQADAGARHALARLDADLQGAVCTIAVRAFAPLPDTIEACITDHRAHTWADSAMYRLALADAACALGWHVSWYDKARVFDAAAGALGANLDSVLMAMGRAAGPPWRARHKLAAVAAIAAGHTAPHATH